ncbi:thioredoxin reductase (NADPH) [Tumebacillus sp. BK434]|uniref:NAD(P)/FAD-dependent oxidoreductase n=1 Tax=Tumebacillus sp. BK434 TaxID=2512169 RepID=UPI0010CF75FE|nr:NAD(P)/FAD-dependent oxidoreductase [Tumebacillus sp. BK434]TCP55375.1 thioredoxin reductase (NADPH) [Tumebacillus sp. BK434]
MNRQRDVVILGGGPAGMTAALWCRRLGLSHLLLEAEERLGGQLFAIQNEVIDYPAVPVKSGAELQVKFAAHVELLGCEIERGVWVREVHLAERLMRVRLANGGEEQIGFRGLIAATGGAERRLGVPGEQEMIDRGEVYSATRDRERFAGKRAAVVGGGDRAFEGALLLAEHGADVVLIHRSEQFRAREEFLQPVLAHPKIELLTHAKVERIYGERAVQGVEVALRDGTVQQLEVQGLFVRIGVEPNSHLLRGQVATDAEGYPLVDATGQTSFPGVFAVGDLCTRPLYSGIASAVGQAMIAAKQVSLYVEQKGAEL